jgi:hypothetical protein
MPSKRKPKKEKRPSGLTAKQQEVYDARMLGFKFDHIAKSLGYASAAGARQAFEKACEILKLEARSELQKLAYSTYETLKNKYFNQAMSGNLKAAYFVATMMEKQVDLLGAREHAPALPAGDGNTYHIIWDVPKEMERTRKRLEAQRAKENSNMIEGKFKELPG